MTKTAGRYWILLGLCTLFLAGCQGLQVNVPVEVQSVPREESALLVLVENKSTRWIKINYPISSGFLKQGQYTVFSLPQPGNYKVVITAYAEDHRYRDVFRPVVTREIPVFLNGYDIVSAKGKFVGYHLEVTDGMILPGK
jgi:hypothetical protein